MTTTPSWAIYYPEPTQPANNVRADLQLQAESTDAALSELSATTFSATVERSNSDGFSVPPGGSFARLYTGDVVDWDATGVLSYSGANRAIIAAVPCIVTYHTQVEWEAATAQYYEIRIGLVSPANAVIRHRGITRAPAVGSATTMMAASWTFTLAPGEGVTTLLRHGAGPARQMVSGVQAAVVQRVL